MLPVVFLEEETVAKEMEGMTGVYGTPSSRSYLLKHGPIGITGYL